MRKVCVVVGSRANYSSIKSAMCAIARHPDLELQTVVAASALLERYGHVGQLVEQDGFTPAARVYMLIEGETPATMAKSTGLGPDLFAQGVGGVFQLDRPFLLLSQHPVTTEYGAGEQQITETLQAIRRLGLPAVALWPNADAGSDDVARGMRKFREHCDDSTV